MSSYVPTIGLEIHAELKTQTKMFCSSRNDPFAGDANVHICPICLAHPGTLPVINREAVRHVLRVGTALSAQLADYTEFDRKNYFYPDLPKGYQLSQYEFPLVSGGELAGVQITRVHLEEDTASSIHDEATGVTAIDYNRAGVPLMELVTEPVIISAEQAGRFARELQLLLRYLGASEANMEKGEMRVEANVSVGKTQNAGSKAQMGTKVEIKNLNSFRAMERAVDFEIKRQISLLERGENVIQETRGWDEGKQATFSQRIKEGSADYRYFPDPDLPSLKISEIEAFSPDALRASLPELPETRRSRLRALGVKNEDVELFVSDTRFGDYFDALQSMLNFEGRKLASNYIANDLVSIIRDIEDRDSVSVEKMPISLEHFASLIGMASRGEINSRATKDILGALASNDQDPMSYAKEHGLLQVEDESKLNEAIEAVIRRHTNVVQDYKAGKAAALEFLVGQCMKELRGAGNPAKLRILLQAKIG